MYLFELSVFWHLFGYFSSNAIHFLVFNKKIVSYFEKFNGLLFPMIQEFYRSFLICKSVSYRKGMRVCPARL